MGRVFHEEKNFHLSETRPNLYVSEKITDNRFKIAGGEPGMEVSWQVTGIRKDAFAEANRIQVEVDKPTKGAGQVSPS